MIVVPTPTYLPLRGLRTPNSNPSPDPTATPTLPLPYPTPNQVIVVPTLLNCAKWTQRSKEDAEFVGDF